MRSASIRQDKVSGATEIGKHQGGKSVLTASKFKDARGRTDTAFEAERAHARPCPDTALLHRRTCSLQSRFRIGFAQGHCLNIAQVGVIALHHHRIDGACGTAYFRIFGNCPADERVHTGSNAKGVGQKDRRFQRPEFIDLYQTSTLSEAVDHLDGGRKFLAKEIARVRHDCRETGSEVALAHGSVPNRNTIDVRKGIQGAGFQSAAYEAMNASGESEGKEDMEHRTNNFTVPC